MMLDAFLPEGVTELAVDSIFMMPQLGVLAAVHERAATEVFRKDCLIRLGSAVAPWGPGRAGELALKASLTRAGGKKEEYEVLFGDIRCIAAPLGEVVEAVLTPGKNLDLGEGKGRSIKAQLAGGEVGILLDGRGRRPFVLPEARDERIALLNKWIEALQEYPAAPRRARVAQPAGAPVMAG